MDDAPATKGDITELRQQVLNEIGELRLEVRNEIGELRQEMHDGIAASESRMMEAMRNIETSLLKAFYGYAETTRQRFAMVEGQTENVIARVKIIEDRVFEIEKRLNLPPAA